MSEAIIRDMEPVIKHAESMGLYLRSTHKGVWFAPNRLRKEQAEGNFLLGPSNWTMGEPPQKHKEDWEDFIGSIQSGGSRQYHIVMEDIQVDDSHPPYVPVDNRIKISKLEENAKLRRDVEFLQLGRIRESIPDLLSPLERKVKELIAISPVDHYVCVVDTLHEGYDVILYLHIEEEYRNIGDIHHHIAQIKISAVAVDGMLTITTSLISDNPSLMGDVCIAVSIRIEDLFIDNSKAQDFINTCESHIEHDERFVNFIKEIAMKY